MIVVNSSTRQFNIPGADVTFGVESDSGSERKYFQCPRYVGNNLDVAGSFVRINYRNANGDIDTYLVNDLTVDGENVVFSWELYPKVTQFKGQIKFVLCVVGPDTRVKWHTTLGTGQVYEGLEPDHALLESDTADVVAQLIAMVEAQTEAVETEGSKQIKAVQTAAQTAQSAAVAQIEAKGASTLATIPGEYKAAVNAVQSAANAIRGKVSGEVIRVDDVSPMEHYPVVRVSGKNLIPYPYEQMEKTVGSRTLVALPDGGVQGSGVPTEFIGLNLCHNVKVERSKTITMSASGEENGLSVQFTLTATNGDAIKSFTLSSGESASYTAKEDTLVGVLVKRASNGTEMVGTIYAQLELGDTATEYTPYIDPTTVTVSRCGRNIIPYPYDGTSYGNGITFTDNGDGSITLNGTNNGESNSVFYITKDNYIPFPAGSYTGYLGATDISLMGVVKGGGYKTLHSSFKLSETVEMRSIYLQVVKGSTVTFDNVKVYPFAEVGATTVTYEPYTGETQIPSPDGTVSGLSAVSPSMTLLTDKVGVNIECEYSRDTNAVIAEILEKITALGG